MTFIPFKKCKTYLSNYDYLIKYYTTTSNEELEDEVLKQLENFSKNQFNISVEALACGYISDLRKFYNRKFRTEVYYLLYKIYPYFMYQIGYYKTIKQQINFIEKLKELDNKYKIIIQQYTTNLKIITSHLEDYYMSYKNNTCIHNFNGLIGINFKETNLTYDKLPKNLFIIHCGFNNQCENIIYDKQKFVKENFLNYEVALTTGKSHIPIQTLKRDTCWELVTNGKVINSDKYVKGLNTEFKLDLNDKNDYYLVICYDNSLDNTKCIYSLSRNTYNINQINVLVNGGLIYQLELSTLKLYVSKMFYIRMNMIIEDSPESDLSKTKELKNMIAKVIMTCYDPDYNVCIKKTTELLKHEPYIKEYLLKLSVCTVNDKLDIRLYKECLENYFLPINK